MSGDTREPRKVKLEGSSPSVNAHGTGLHQTQPRIPQFSAREMPGYAAPTRSSSSKTRSAPDQEHRSREDRSREDRSRDPYGKARSKERQSKEHRSKSREKPKSQERKTEANRQVAFTAHTLPAKLPSARDFYMDDSTRPSRRRPRQSKSADGRHRVVPPWATGEVPVHLNEGCFFSNVRSPRPSFFFIHPEWASEVVSRRRLNIVEKPQVVMSGRRCFSAPPCRSRNPITWEYS